MAEMIELKQVKEKVILVGVSTDDHDIFVPLPRLG